MMSQLRNNYRQYESLKRLRKFKNEYDKRLNREEEQEI